MHVLVGQYYILLSCIRLDNKAVITHNESIATTARKMITAVIIRGCLKRRLHSSTERRGAFVQCGHFANKEEGGSSDAKVRTFGAKNFESF